jgi:hypothetical protein
MRLPDPRPDLLIAILAGALAWFTTLLLRAAIGSH